MQYRWIMWFLQIRSQGPVIWQLKKNTLIFQLHQRYPILFLVFKRTLNFSYIVKLPSGVPMSFVGLRELIVLSNYHRNEFLRPWLRTQFKQPGISVFPLLKSYYIQYSDNKRCARRRRIFLEFCNQCSEIVTLCACISSSQLYPKRTAGVLQNREKNPNHQIRTFCS